MDEWERDTRTGFEVAQSVIETLGRPEVVRLCGMKWKQVLWNWLNNPRQGLSRDHAYRLSRIPGMPPLECLMYKHRRICDVLAGEIPEASSR